MTVGTGNKNMIILLELTNLGRCFKLSCLKKKIQPVPFDERTQQSEWKETADTSVFST